MTKEFFYNNNNNNHNDNNNNNNSYLIEMEHSYLNVAHFIYVYIQRIQ